MNAARTPVSQSDEATVPGTTQVLDQPVQGRRSIRKKLLAVTVGAATMVGALVGAMNSPASAHDWAGSYHRRAILTTYPFGGYNNNYSSATTLASLHGDYPAVLEGQTSLTAKDSRGFYVCMYVRYLASDGYQFGTSATRRFGVTGNSTRTYYWSEAGPNYWNYVETIKIVQYTC